MWYKFPEEINLRAFPGPLRVRIFASTAIKLVIVDHPIIDLDAFGNSLTVWLIQHGK